MNLSIMYFCNLQFAITKIIIPIFVTVKDKVCIDLLIFLYDTLI